MCLAVPGRIIAIRSDSEPRMGTVDFGGVRKEVCLAILPEAAPGDYVVVHVGFALSLLDEEEARETLKLLESMNGDTREAITPPEDTQ